VGSCIQTGDDVETLAKVEVMMLISLIPTGQIPVLCIDSDYCKWM